MRLSVSPQIAVITFIALCHASAQQQQRTVSIADACKEPAKIETPAPEYMFKPAEEKQPTQTADLPSVVRTVDQALECYQAVAAEKDKLQPTGLPKLSSATMDFKVTTGKTVGFTLSVFVFKIGASREKDVTDDLTFTYSVPKVVPAKGAQFAKVKPQLPLLYQELVKEVQAAARAAQAQSTALGMPLNQVGIMVSYGIKFDGNVSINAPVELVTISGNGDYNKNNIQSITLKFGKTTEP